MTFKTKNICIDHSKKTIVMYDKENPDEYSHVYGTGRVFYEYLSKQYNIIMFNTGLQSKHIKNQITIDRNFIHHNYYRIANVPNAKEKNLYKFYLALDELFKSLEINSVEYFIGIADMHFQLPFKNYVNSRNDNCFDNLKNTFFDTASDDKVLIEKIDLATKKVINDMAGNVGILAFSSRYTHVGFFLPLYLHNTGMLKHKCIFFSIDPTLFSPFFINHGIPSKFLYFADDTRGTRKFEKFDIAQFQHIVYEPKFLGSELFESKKDKTFLFYGTIFQEKGPRKDVYYQFLHDLSIPNSAMYVPLYKNKSVVNKKNENHFKNLNLDQFGKLYDDVLNHPLIEKNKTLYPANIPNELKKYKYNFIPRCVSPEDSLNFRPILSALCDSLPLIDHMYDPCNLQIPKKLNDALIVKNSDDIMKKIEYYNKHEDERLHLIEGLKTHFGIHEYLENQDLVVKNKIKCIIPEFTFQ